MKIPLFDNDWTLLAKDKTKNIHNDSFFYAFEKVYGLENPKIDWWEGKIDNQIILETAILNGFSEEEAKKKLSQAVQVMVNYFNEHKDEGVYTVLPGVVDLLKELKERNAVMGLLTGNIDEIGWGKIQKGGVKDYFQFGAFGNEALKRVDLVEIAREKAEKLLQRKVNFEELVIIGDTPLDIACAKGGKIKSIGVASSPNYSIEDLQKAEAGLVVASLEEKEKVLEFLQ